MPRLIVALMIAALSTEDYTTSSWKSAYYSEDQEILKALRDVSHASIPLSAKTAVNLLADKVHFPNRRFSRTAWWILPQTIKKRQDMSPYNINSFGLRYGK
ncbi:metastasis-suppressor KiSS-1 [Anabas testudineus]|nr:metastasis-suppressor KiSS-1 [Anabas testudineus]